MPPKTFGAKLGDAINVVIAKAPDMRAAGLESFEFEGLSVKLRAPDVQGGQDGATMAPEPSDPFEDAALYPSGRVPGFGKPSDEED